MPISNSFLGFGDPSASLRGLGSLFKGGEITDHIRRTPDLARSMRYSPSNAGSQVMQDYLGPLAAFDFAKQAGATGDIGGIVASAGAPAYTGLKAVAPKLASDWFGTGEALTSAASLDQVQNAWGGLAEGFGSSLSNGLKKFADWFKW